MQFFFKKDNSLIGYEISGHADYAEHGEDIICAGVSTLAINTANSIEKFTDDTLSESSNEDEGYLKVIINGVVSRESELLLNSLLLGINQISEIDNGKYVKVEFKEV